MLSMPGYALDDAPTMTDLYSILHVQRDAKPEIIRAAHRALAWRHHPDFGGDAKRMAAINLAWSILGNPARRARYDAGPQAGTAAAGPAQSKASATTTPTPITRAPSDMRDAAAAGMRSIEQRDGGTVLDFGRYQGWTVGTLADHDPNYLRWLARTPIGRRLSVEIDAALGRRDAEASALRPTMPSGPRRPGIFGGLGTPRAGR